MWEKGLRFRIAEELNKNGKENFTNVDQKSDFSGNMGPTGATVVIDK